MMKDDCIFCKLANGVFPTNYVYEDEDFKVILDAAPAAKGHCLILPKNHAKDLFEVDDAAAAKILPLAKKIAYAVKEATGCDGINIVQNNGPAAGQTVFHLHVHVIPRFDGDQMGITWTQNSPTDEEQKALAEKITGCVK